MNAEIIALTPPFTQLNTPYPATAYIKGFLKTKSINCFQADLGIELILKLFSKKGLSEIFQYVEKNSITLSDNDKRIIALKDEYIAVIDETIRFLQGKSATLATQICSGNFLPQASRFDEMDELDWAFGSMGLQDKAKFLATLFLEDLSDFITEQVDAHFGFSRYAERLGRSANSFDELYAHLHQPYTYIDNVLITLLEEKFSQSTPKLVLISVPFPGNLYSGFRIAQWFKSKHPNTKIAMGGGFANTELRSISDSRVFEFYDFICLDDGEAPIEELIKSLDEKSVENRIYKRTFLLENGKVVYKDNSTLKDYKLSETGTPDYADLLLEKYISVIETINPMHKLWSDGRWNKLTMAHGCYWGKCTFCDISLDYIKIYEPVNAKLICDRMEELIQLTGETGFHFVDEAAPPSLMQALAIEILRRKLKVSWWTNIRFEKSFSSDLCYLLRASGCIAVSGGLEVASDRLLDLIQKGVSVAQVARVTSNFTEAGIMVHAYLMYGFPTQTAQETIDSLEMVRQMFEIGTIQSGFWHQFALTAHSPVGINPEEYSIKITNDSIGSFANNDLNFTDKQGVNHDLFSFGLKKSLHNYMQGVGFDFPLQHWFDFKVPKTKIPPMYINQCLNREENRVPKPSAKIIWLGQIPSVITHKKNKSVLLFFDKKDTLELELKDSEAIWFQGILEKISIKNNKIYTYQEIKNDFEAFGLKKFEAFFLEEPIWSLKEYGLLIL